MRTLSACIAIATGLALAAPASAASGEEAKKDDSQKGEISKLEEDKKELEKKVKKLEKALEPADECPGFLIPDGTAETQCPVYVELNAGLELQRDDDGSNFSDSFPRIGLRARVQTHLMGDEEPSETYDFVGRTHGLLNMSLTSIAVQKEKDPKKTDETTSGTGGQESNSKEFTVEGERAWQGEGGILFDLVDFRLPKRTRRITDKNVEALAERAYRAHQDCKDALYCARLGLEENCQANPKTAKSLTDTPAEREKRINQAVEAANLCLRRTGAEVRRLKSQLDPTVTLGVLATVGAISPDGMEQDLLQRHFGGIRLYYRGKSLFNGLTFDVGWGMSENFVENTDKRIKFRGYFPFRLTRSGDAPTKVALNVEVDSDFEGGDDEIKLGFTTAVDINRVLSALSLGNVGGLLSAN